MPFGRKPNEFPSHLWTQCPSCNEMLFNKQLARNLNVCTKCEHHFRLGSRERIELLVDKGSFHEHDATLTSGDPLGFTDSKPYPERIAAAQTKSGEKDAIITGEATIGDNPVILAVMDFEFMGGSMGSVVGEKLTRSAERAFSERKPLVIVSASVSLKDFGSARSSTRARAPSLKWWPHFWHTLWLRSSCLLNSISPQLGHCVQRLDGNSFVFRPNGLRSLTLERPPRDTSRAR